MHKIASDSKALQSVFHDLTEAQDAVARYQQRHAEARAEYEREQQAALNRGEHLSPKLEVIPDPEVERHLNARLYGQQHDLSLRVKQFAPALIEKLEAREGELLAEVSGRKVKDLPPLAREIEVLRDTKGLLLRLSNYQTFQGVPSLTVTPGPAIPLPKLIEAALEGGSLIGRTPPLVAPEPRRIVDMSSPEGEAMLTGGDGRGGQVFR